MNVEPEIPVLSRLAALLSDQPDLQLALVFGSVASGRVKPESDLDLAVMADAPLTAERKIDLIAELAKASGRPVDLVDLRTAGLPVTRSALFGGKKLLCRDNAVFAALLSRTLIDSADFLPLRERLLKRRRDGWIH